MKLLQRYPWLIDPADRREWVPVEATPIVEAITVGTMRETALWEMPCRPPWAFTALEFSFPHHIRPRFLALCMVTDDPDVMARSITGAGHKPTLAGGATAGPATHRFQFTYFQSIGRVRPEKLGHVAGLLNKDGEAQQVLTFPGPHVRPEDKDGAHRWLSDLGVATLSVFAFLNCRNVSTRPEPPPPGPLLKKRAERGVPEIAYQQLVVDGRPLVRHAGRETPEEAEWRYHICRGNIAHYGDCCPGRHAPNGLRFGKETGRFWRSAHVRGSRAHGEIVKDYLVRPQPEGVS